MHHILTKGATSQILTVTLRSATTGQRLTGKTYSDVTINSHRQGASPSAYTPVTMTAGTWVSQGWVETSVAGVYQLGVRNADLASGADGCKISVTASGAIDKDIDIALLDADLRNATSLGLSRLDAAVGSRSSHSAADVVMAGNVDGYTLEEATRLILAVLAGKVSGAAAGAPIVFRAADDSADRVTATTDSDGNRTAVTLDAAVE